VLAALVILAGPFVGSFLGVLADRLPEGRDVIAARSRCDGCGGLLRPREMVPLLSFLLQRGRCLRCGARIPRHLPATEGLAALAGCAAAGLAQGQVAMVMAAGWLWALVALGVTDWRHRRLPDPLTAALAGLGAGLGLAQGAAPEHVALSALAGAGAFWAIRLGYRALRGREGLGAGDVKLMAGIGAATPLWALPHVTLVAALAALAAVALHPGLRAAARAQGGGAALPFGTFLCLGGALVWAGLNLLA